MYKLILKHLKFWTFTSFRKVRNTSLDDCNACRRQMNYYQTNSWDRTQFSFWNYKSYLFLDLLLLLFLALFEGLLLLLTSLLLLWPSLTGVDDACSRLPLDTGPLDWIGNETLLSVLPREPLFWANPVWAEVWFLPLASLLLADDIAFELPKLQLSSLPLLPICDSDSLYRSTGMRSRRLLIARRRYNQARREQQYHREARYRRAISIDYYVRSGLKGKIIQKFVHVHWLLLGKVEMWE